MSAANCPICQPQYSSCIGSTECVLSTLTIETQPDGSSCGVPAHPDTEGQEVEVRSSKTKDVNVEVEISTDHSSVEIDGQRKKTISVPARSSGNDACFHLKCTNSNAPRKVGVEIEVTLDRGEKRPSSQLATLNVNRRP